MSAINIEFKASVDNITAFEEKLLALQPVFAGLDHQIDTYFNVPEGRLKLREGNIENALIYYERSDEAGAKQSNIILYQHTPDKNLKAILSKTIGVKVVVDKKRKIYFINNVKFHFDVVDALGTFIEVEAIDRDGSIGIATLQQQQYIAVSYSDMLTQV
jgi:adenylate cyclase, class 2